MIMSPCFLHFMGFLPNIRMLHIRNMLQKYPVFCKTTFHDLGRSGKAVFSSSFRLYTDLPLEEQSFLGTIVFVFIQIVYVTGLVDRVAR